MHVPHKMLIPISSQSDWNANLKVIKLKKKFASFSCARSVIAASKTLQHPYIARLGCAGTPGTLHVSARARTRANAQAGDNDGTVFVNGFARAVRVDSRGPIARVVTRMSPPTSNPHRMMKLSIELFSNHSDVMNNSNKTVEIEEKMEDDF